MARTTLTIRGVDPLLFRDGRPFTADAGGLTARSLPLPYPPTVAGFIRTQYGQGQGWAWTPENGRLAEEIPVHGPLLMRGDEVLLPAPTDSLFLEGSARPIRLTPNSSYVDGCDLPSGLMPVIPTAAEAADGKPRSGFRYWPVSAMLRWLEGIAPDKLDDIRGLPEEDRLGIAIGEDGRAEESKLYTAQLRAFGEREQSGYGRPICDYALLARANLPDSSKTAQSVVQTTGTLGGERRLTIVAPLDDDAQIWPRCPEPLAHALASSQRIRLVLATPAHFRGGWKPGWLDASGAGAPPILTLDGVRMVLAAVASDRRVAFSGWGLNAQGRSGPGPIRWLVPAGAVYFFETKDAISPKIWQDAWLEPVSDDEQDQRNGLGLALWGIW